ARPSRMVEENPGRILLEFFRVLFHRCALLRVRRIRRKTHGGINVEAFLVFHGRFHGGEQRLVVRRVFDAGFAKWQGHVRDCGPGKHRHGPKQASEKNSGSSVHKFLLRAGDYERKGKRLASRNAPNFVRFGSSRSGSVPSTPGAAASPCRAANGPALFRAAPDPWRSAHGEICRASAFFRSGSRPRPPRATNKSPRG